MKLVKFLPVENIIYKTPLTEDEVIKAVAEKTEPSKFRFFSSNSSKTYEGKIEGKTFDISRIINYRNSFLPQISGAVSREPDGTAIKIKMQLHPVVFVFIFIFIGIAGLIFFPVLFFLIAKGEFKIELLLGLVFMIFPYALTMGGFKFESVKSKESLRELFKAKIISD